MKPSKSFAIIVAGFVLLMPVSWYLGDPQFNRQQGTYEEIPRNHSFDPRLAKRKKVLLIGACTIVNHAVANFESPASNMSVRYAQMGSLTEILNLIGAPREEAPLFIEFSQAGTYFAEHLFYFYHSLRVPEAKTLLYSHPIENFNFFSENHFGSALETLAVLEKIEGSFPSPVILRSSAIIKSFILHSEQYKHEITHFGDQWRSKLNPKLLTLSGAQEEHLPPSHRFLSQIRSLFSAGEWIRNWALSEFRMFHDPNYESDDKAFLSLIEIESKRRVTPETTAFPVNWNRYLTYYTQDEEARARYAFIQLLAEVSKLRGIHLVVYFPPLLIPKKSQAHNPYLAGYVRPTENLLSQYGFTTIDHTQEAGLDVNDYLYSLEPNGSRVLRSGSVTLFGNVKRAIHLRKALNESRLLTDGPETKNKMESIKRLLTVQGNT